MPNAKIRTKRPLRLLLCHTREDFYTHTAKNTIVRQNTRLDGAKEQMCTLISGLMSELGRSARDPGPGPSGGAVAGPVRGRMGPWHGRCGAVAGPERDRDTTGAGP